MIRSLLLVVALLGALAHAPAAQSNADPAIDVLLANIADLTALGRTGPFPNGVTGCAFETTACNLGSKEVPWMAAMDADHPFISFLLARESNGRFEQISDRSYVKHGFFALSSSFCSSCSPTDGTKLGLGCSDTYSTNNNGNLFWLGPPSEIDPWMGEWNPVCSHFDRGEPPVATPFDCNGQRSLTTTQVNALGDVSHRIRVRDADFNVPGAAFWFQGMYTIETESEVLRDNNLGSRGFTASWSGTRWNLSATGSLLHGSVLQRWSGATLNSATNGGDDGRLYVATKVTGPVDGFYHYEVAVHNRDNARGVGQVRIPVCPSARVRDLGFGDVDSDASNDWTASVVGSEIVFTSASNPLPWNTLFNFWFDSDAAPSDAAYALDQALPGPGLASVAVTGQAPLGLYNVHLGAGCALGVPASLFATGTPARATLGNATFAIVSRGNAPGQPHVLYYSPVNGSFPFGGCTVFLGSMLGQASFAGSTLTDGSGIAVHPVPIGASLALEGLEVNLQAVARRPGAGSLFTNFELSDALRVRVGNAVSDCP